MHIQSTCPLSTRPTYTFMSWTWGAMLVVAFYLIHISLPVMHIAFRQPDHTHTVSVGRWEDASPTCTHDCGSSIQKQCVLGLLSCHDRYDPGPTGRVRHVNRPRQYLHLWHDDDTGGDISVADTRLPCAMGTHRLRRRCRYFSREGCVCVTETYQAVLGELVLLLLAGVTMAARVRFVDAMTKLHETTHDIRRS